MLNVVEEAGREIRLPGEPFLSQAALRPQDSDTFPEHLSIGHATIEQPEWSCVDTLKSILYRAHMKVRSELWVRLPTFAVQVLKRRAEEQLQTVSGVLESLLCDSIGTDEVRAMASESEGFARLFEAWLRYGDPEPGVTLPSGWRVRLRQAVRKSGKTQTVVARECDLTPESLSRILSAEHARPSFQNIAKIANAAGVSLGWLMEEPGFTMTDEQRAKVRSVGVLLLNLTGGLPKP